MAIEQGSVLAVVPRAEVDRAPEQRSTEPVVLLDPPEVSLIVFRSSAQIPAIISVRQLALLALGSLGNSSHRRPIDTEERHGSER